MNGATTNSEDAPKDLKPQIDDRFGSSSARHGISPMGLADTDNEKHPLLDSNGKQHFQLQGFQGLPDVEELQHSNSSGRLKPLSKPSALHTWDNRQDRYLRVGLVALVAAMVLGAGFLLIHFIPKQKSTQHPVDVDVLDLINGHKLGLGGLFHKPLDNLLPREQEDGDEGDNDASHNPESDDDTGTAQSSSVAKDITPRAHGSTNGSSTTTATSEHTFFRWIYKMPVTATAKQWKASPHATADLNYCHMAMLTQLPNGHLASLFQGSTVPGEGNSQQTLYWQTSSDGGITWSDPGHILPHLAAVSDSKPLPVWSPVLHVQDSKVHVFFSVSVEQCCFKRRTRYGTERWTPGGSIMQITSYDNGTTWGDLKTVYGFAAEGGIPKVIANKLAVVAAADSHGNDTWLLPFWRENDTGDAPESCNTRRDLMGVPAVLRSTDQGITWEPSSNVDHDSKLPYNWMIENTVLAATPGSRVAKPLDLLQLFRTPRGIPMYSSRSKDGGRSWSTAAQLALPNPDSKVHAVTLPNGDLLLAYNDSPNLRTPLALALSRDGGQFWTRVTSIEGDPCGEFGYPTIQVVASERRVLVAYTVLFAIDKMAPVCKRKYSGSASKLRPLPPSGIRVYGTTLESLEDSWVAASNAT